MDICPPIISVKKKQTQQKKASKFPFSSELLQMEEKWPLFVDSSDMKIKGKVINLLLACWDDDSPLAPVGA